MVGYIPIFGKRYVKSQGTFAHKYTQPFIETPSQKGFVALNEKNYKITHVLESRACANYKNIVVVFRMADQCMSKF